MHPWTWRVKDITPGQALLDMETTRCSPWTITPSDKFSHRSVGGVRILTVVTGSCPFFEFHVGTSVDVRQLDSESNSLGGKPSVS